MQSRSAFLKPALAKVTQFNEKSILRPTTTVIEKVRPVGAIAHGRCPPPAQFCDTFGVDVMVKKGALPHFTATELSNPSSGWYIPQDMLYSVFLPGDTHPSYYLFKDKSLPGTGFPGAVMKVKTISNVVTQSNVDSNPVSPSTTYPLRTRGSLTSHDYIDIKGGMSGSANINTFVPIPWAIPVPYSIRNIPYTSIWLKITQPALPLNTETLVFKVNGLDVSPQCTVTNVPGGIEILYTPSSEFPLNSRVYVDVYISASPSQYWTFATDCLEQAEYIKINGDSTYAQAGGTMTLGPNSSFQTEFNSVRAIISANEVLIYRTQYAYHVGDTIEYIGNDYPIRLSYWFDIVNDFYPPVITNMYPSDSMVGVDVNQRISFDIFDEGLGVDIESLMFTINNLVVYPEIWKYSDNYYHVFYDPIVPYYYNSNVDCFATVRDLSTMENWTSTVWSFNTSDTEQPILLNPKPSACAYPVHLKSDVYVDIYGREGGIDKHSIIFTVDQQEKEIAKHPKIYRLS